MADELKKGLTDALAKPVYEDVFQPSARFVGTALAETVRMALKPVRFGVWGLDQAMNYAGNRVCEILGHIPPDHIIPTNPALAGPAIQAIRYSSDEAREMYARLIAASMVKQSAPKAHPSFVEIIRQLTPDEAKILALFAKANVFPIVDLRSEEKRRPDDKFGLKVSGWNLLQNYSLLGVQAGCEFPKQASAYIDNICRLGLAHIPEGRVTDDKFYEAILNDHTFLATQQSIDLNGSRASRVIPKRLEITAFGQEFRETCIPRDGVFRASPADQVAQAAQEPNR